MIVCQCRALNHEVVDDALDEGACTLAQVCRATGAGQDCGGCVFSLKRLICKYEESATAYLEVDGAAS